MIISELEHPIYNNELSLKDKVSCYMIISYCKNIKNLNISSSNEIKELTSFLSKNFDIIDEDIKTFLDVGLIDVGELSNLNEELYPMPIRLASKKLIKDIHGLDIKISDQIDYTFSISGKYLRGVL